MLRGGMIVAYLEREYLLLSAYAVESLTLLRHEVKTANSFFSDKQSPYTHSGMPHKYFKKISKSS